MAAFEPVLSRNWNVADSHTLKVYESRGGYQAARKALATRPRSVVTLVKDSELRGRGGAGFPCGLKWTFLPKDRTETLMCINADESEPGTFNNRLLMEEDPHQVLEGILIACFATKATRPISTCDTSTFGRTRFSKRRSTKRGQPATSARTSRAPASISMSTCTAAPARISAAKRPG